MKKWMKIEEEYKIEGEVIERNGAIYLTFTGFFVDFG
jgi:hypothetical protein